MYAYVKALHIIFIVTWFSGLFYMVRLFIYDTEANEQPEPARTILHTQFGLMIRRLWLGITWPSAMLTLIFGPWMWIMLGGTPRWLQVKLVFVVLLFGYHWTLHVIYRQQRQGIYRFSGQQLRIWNEGATMLLFAIVFVATVKQGLSWIWGVLGIIALGMVLMLAIRIYKRIRENK